jgi:hypothetical protein
MQSSVTSLPTLTAHLLIYAREHIYRPVVPQQATYSRYGELTPLLIIHRRTNELILKFGVQVAVVASNEDNLRIISLCECLELSSSWRPEILDPPLSRVRGWSLADLIKAKNCYFLLYSLLTLLNLQNFATIGHMIISLAYRIPRY